MKHRRPFHQLRHAANRIEAINQRLLTEGHNSDLEELAGHYADYAEGVARNHYGMEHQMYLPHMHRGSNQ